MNASFLSHASVPTIVLPVDGIRWAERFYGTLQPEIDGHPIRILEILDTIPDYTYTQLRSDAQSIKVVDGLADGKSSFVSFHGEASPDDIAHLVVDTAWKSSGKSCQRRWQTILEAAVDHAYDRKLSGRLWNFIPARRFAPKPSVRRLRVYFSPHQVLGGKRFCEGDVLHTRDPLAEYVDNDQFCISISTREDAIIVCADGSSPDLLPGQARRAFLRASADSEDTDAIILAHYLGQPLNSSWKFVPA